MKIIVIGCGRMGSGLVQALCLRGHTVNVVDKDMFAFERLCNTFRGHMITGEGADRTALLRAGIEQADGLAAVTSSDETNASAARLAREEFHVPKVVARLYDPRNASMYQRLGIQMISSTTWGVNLLADAMCYSQLDAVASVAGGKVDIVEIEVPALLVGRPIGALAIPGESQVVAVSRAGRAFLFTPGEVFHPGDLVDLAVMSDASEHLKTMLASA